MSQPSAGSHNPGHAPKNRNGARNAILATAGAGLVFVVAAVIWGGTGDNPGANLPVVSTPVPSKVTSPATVPTVSKATTAAPSKVAVPAPPKNENKVTVAKVGDQFEVGNGGLTAGKYRVLAGWTLTSEYGNPTITGRVKNIDDDKSPLPNLQLKFLSGSDLLMSFTCTASELEEGQTTKMNCFSADDYTTKYKTIVAETGL